MQLYDEVECGPGCIATSGTPVDVLAGDALTAIDFALRRLATMTLGGVAQVYDGSPRAVSVTTSPPGLAVSVSYTGSGGTPYPTSTTPPTEAGSYWVVAVVTDPAYAGSPPVSATLTVSNPATTITALTPSSGPDYGGTPITITGSGFLAGTVVRIDGTVVPSTFVDSTTITTITPASSASGPVAVVVSNPAPALGEGAGVFMYLAYPKITAISPASGESGATVTITGADFSETDAAIWFGDEPAAVVSRTSTQLLVTVPAGLTPGLVDVTVTNVAVGRSRVYAGLFRLSSSAPERALSVAAGQQFTCVVTAAGGVQCWGLGTNGRLGGGTSSAPNSGTSGTPADVTGLNVGVSAVSASRGGGHACALTSSGGVKCWGANSSGQLGDGTTTQRWTPVDVVGLSAGVAEIVTGSSHACALTAAGGVKCWGANSSGQFGDGTTTLRSSPVDVVGLSSGVSAVSAGGTSTCA